MTKTATDPFLEITDPSEAIGLWSRQCRFEVKITPIWETLSNMGTVTMLDMARWETWDEMREAMMSRNTERTPAWRLREWDAQYGRDKPRWFNAWRTHSSWMTTLSTTTSRPERIRLSFGCQVFGNCCFEEHMRCGRVFFPIINGVKHLAVMLKAGWGWWDQIEHTYEAGRESACSRLLLTKRDGIGRGTCDLALLRRMVTDRELCIFRIEADPLFDAVTDNELNPKEVYAHLAREFAVFMKPDHGEDMNDRLTMQYSVTFNPQKRKYLAVDKTSFRNIDVMLERKKEWANRPIAISDPAKAEDVAREVVLKNGCALTHGEPPEDLRRALMTALFWVTFPDRRADEPGGILRGYQLPGRMVLKSEGVIRHTDVTHLVRMTRDKGAERIAAKRNLLVDVLMARAAKAVAARNGLSEEDARKRIDDAGARTAVEKAAWKLGMMEGSPIVLFHGQANAGVLKLPDLSLALACEQALGLDGSAGTMEKLVQTARVRPLADSCGWYRHCLFGPFKAHRLWTPQVGKGDAKIEFPKGAVWVLREYGLYYLMIIPKYAMYQHDRDLAYTEGDTEGLAVTAYRCFSQDGTRSRENVEITTEKFDWKKIHRLAKQGRIYLYSVDFGEAKWAAELTFTTDNATPCVFCASTPKIAAKASDEDVEVDMWFTINPTVPREGRKFEGRSWKNYLDAYPDEAKRAVVRWPAEGLTDVRNAAIECIKRDAVLLTDKDHLQEAVEALSYIYLPEIGPRNAGGAYCGCQLRDRAFKDEDGRVSWREERARQSGETEDKGKAKKKNDRSALKGKRLVEVVPAATATELERLFIEKIENDPISDNRNGGRKSEGLRVKVLDEPLKVTDDLMDIVKREFRRIVYTGTMAGRQQIIRPAHEVAVGIWLTTLFGDRQTKMKDSVPADPIEAKLADIEEQFNKGLITEEERAQRRASILSEI